MVSSRQDALALLQVEEGASERQIRSQVFRKYQEITTALAQIDDERQRPLLEAQLDQLNQARDLLLAAASPSPAVAPPPPWYAPLDPSQYTDLPRRVRVLLYQQGGQEGIHTLQIQGRDTVVLFENAFGARKFAQQLAQKGLPKPVVELIDTDDIVEFCQSSGYGVVLVPETLTVEPPDTKTHSVDDWDLS